jgi:hypothetical protein
MAKANVLSDPMFHDADKAREWLEAQLWKDGPICPHCGVVNEATLMNGETTRPGLYQCNACREPFTVTVAVRALQGSAQQMAGRDSSHDGVQKG